MGFGDNKTGSLTSIRSKTPMLQRREEFTGKSSSRDSSEKVRLLQTHPFPHPQEGWLRQTHPRPQASESCAHEMVVQNDYFEADPHADMPRGLVFSEK